MAGTLAVFATVAVGFVARPLGAAVIGHYGDRIGVLKRLWRVPGRNVTVEALATHPQERA